MKIMSMIMRIMAMLFNIVISDPDNVIMSMIIFESIRRLKNVPSKYFLDAKADLNELHSQIQTDAAEFARVLMEESAPLFISGSDG